VCTYACNYCQVGETTLLTIDRRPFCNPDEILEDVRNRIAKTASQQQAIDYLTFVPDGEPTLDAGLEQAITLLKPLQIPIAVISNGSLLWRAEVRAALGRADWVSLKLDAVRETVWRRINRPHPGLRLTAVLEGMLEFAANFTGTLSTETMLVQGLNTGDECIGEIGDFLQRLQPQTAFLAVPTRPPAEPRVRGPDEPSLNRAFQILGKKVKHVEYLIGYEGNAFAFSGDVAADLLSITAVHPMRAEAVEALLLRAGADWTVVRRLVDRGALAETQYAGHRFYLRRQRRGSAAN
jgi:wyosine [tRNA(Phe)-imidazoG37] synthetase (radical SAM superfamily)